MSPSPSLRLRAPLLRPAATLPSRPQPPHPVPTNHPPPLTREQRIQIVKDHGLTPLTTAFKPTTLTPTHPFASKNAYLKFQLPIVVDAGENAVWFRKEVDMETEGMQSSSLLRLELMLTETGVYMFELRGWRTGSSAITFTVLGHVTATFALPADHDEQMPPVDLLWLLPAQAAMKQKSSLDVQANHNWIFKQLEITRVSDKA